ncbi:MAG: hypothetical protein QXR13_02280 [Candidatus Bathyarchaeia archaeon]
MEDESKHDAVMIIGCRREQFLEIIEHVKKKFPDVKDSCGVLREEVL